MSSVSNDVEAGAGEANRQVFRLLRAAKSAPSRKGGWRPSVKQSKLNRQMCLCSKYLSPAGYYLSPDGVWAHSLQKSNQALLMWCEKPSLLLPQCMNTWSTYKKFTEHQKKCSTTHFSMLAWENPTVRADILLLSSGNLSGEAEATLLPSSSAPATAT